MQAGSLPAEPQGKPPNTGVSSLSLLQGIFPTQESNWGLLHCRRSLYQLNYQGSPGIFFFIYTPKIDYSRQISFIACPRFPQSSVGKEATCNVRDLSSIPGLGRSSGEGISYPFQYSWASLVAQLAKNPPAVQETWVSSLGWEDPLEKGKANHSSILAWRIPRTVWSMGSQRVGHD